MKATSVLRAFSILIFANLYSTGGAQTVPEHTSFQTHAPYSRETDIRSDIAIVYGADDTMSSRVAEWKAQGYGVHFMTGAAWGGYAEYIEGKFDGANHRDEGQVNARGEVIWHDPNVVPYMVPTPSYVQWLISLGRKAIDAGATALHYEEPEFWSAAGYSEGFQRMWQAEYGIPWQRPDSSPDAFWRSSKLKYVLYKRALEQVFKACKEYAKSKGRTVQCYVPTHSIVNYAQWAIVSPESSLMDLPNCDGYIAQVWTGTARTMNRYRNVKAERTFETAFLEYSSMYNMVAPTGRKVFFLADPVEDGPNHTWVDYRLNYRKTIAASLLFPDVADFETMPWPDRVMKGSYLSGEKDSKTPVTIPPDYASELMTVVNALNNMKQDEIEWMAGSHDVAVLASDTMMFQRSGPWDPDPDFNGFYGLAMPLVKAGIPARIVVLEQLTKPESFKGIGTLLMSYEHMKPMKPEFNQVLADWLKSGGSLIYFGSDKDAFHGVQEWWTSSTTARRDLFSRIGADEKITGKPQKIEKGIFLYSPDSGRDLAVRKDGADQLIRMVKDLRAEAHTGLSLTNYIGLRRGPYVTGCVLAEVESTKPLKLRGVYTDLFTSDLALRKDPVINPGDVFLLRDIARARPGENLASNGRIREIRNTTDVLELGIRSPSTVQNCIFRISLPGRPRSVLSDNGKPATVDWSDEGKNARIAFPNRKDPAEIVLRIEF